MPETHEKHSPVALLTIAAIFCLVYAGAAPLQIFVIPHLRANLGFGEIEASFVLASVYISFWIGRAVGGRVLPTLGVRRSVALGVLGYVVFPMALVWFGTPWMLWGAGAAWGFCASIFRVGATSTQLNHCDSGRYGFWAGVGSAALYVGTIAGLAVQVWFSSGRLTTPADVFMHQALFAAAIAAAALVLSVMLPDTIADFPRPTLREMAAAALAKKTAVMSFFVLSSGFGYGIILSTMNRAVKDMGGVEAFLRSLVLFYVVAGLVGFVGGYVSDRVGRGPCLIASFALAALGLALVAAYRDMWSLAVGSALLGVVFGMVPTVATAWVGDISRPKERPLTVSAVFSWRDLGIAAALLVRGVAARLPHPATTTFAVFAAWFMVCAVVGLVRARDIGGPQGKPV